MSNQIYEFVQDWQPGDSVEIRFRRPLEASYSVVTAYPAGHAGSTRATLLTTAAQEVVIEDVEETETADDDEDTRRAKAERKAKREAQREKRGKKAND